MPPEPTLRERVADAAEAVGAVWPLHSFVTANPLAGYEDRPFHEAVEAAAETLGGDGYPSTDTFHRAFESGRIDSDLLCARLADHGYDPNPQTSLDRLADSTSTDVESSDPSPMDRVDAVTSKWLAAFLEQGTAAWAMPNRDRGFYEAFRSVARHDRDVPDGAAIAALPADPADAIRELLANHPSNRWAAGFERHLASLPGWTGLIKRRAADGSDWQAAYPITLTGYVAVRMALAAQFGAPLVPDESTAGTGVDAGSSDGTDAQTDDDSGTDSEVPLAEVWLRAWEASYRGSLVDALSDASASLNGSASGADTASTAVDTASTAVDTTPTTVDNASDDGRPAAQLVFCIDTRSEIIRRHIESAGPYETHGYAGFFGVPMRYDGHDAEATVDACPPIVDACHHVAERPTDAGDDAMVHDRWHGAVEAAESIIESLESNAAAAFSYVESTGLGYGAALAARTLLPARVYDLASALDERVPDVHAFCTPTLDPASDAVADGGSDVLPPGLTLEERVEYAATAFELMGWENFARLVVFAGHASHTTNNPFGSSLDCGACAGNPGGPSARVLATICNDDAVSARLRDRGIDVPTDTVFLAGEHDTTTDTVELYADHVPETHADDLAALRADLETARAGATAERAADLGVDPDAGARDTERRAADWAETRPEWGLAGNAAFVIGPRELTADLDLDGRSFLHSYDWRADPDGDALEAIVGGPMVVTQWINAQYYFATVDNAVFGSGSKVTQNPVGNVGVYQGNGGDLMGGLPLQSLEAIDGEPYHQPIRLSTVVHAPVDRVDAVCASVETVQTLLDNGWLSLTVVDPTREHRAFHYAGAGEWVAVDDRSPVELASPVESAPAGE